MDRCWTFYRYYQTPLDFHWTSRGLRQTFIKHWLNLGLFENLQQKSTGIPPDKLKSSWSCKELLIIDYFCSCINLKHIRSFTLFFLVSAWVLIIANNIANFFRAYFFALTKKKQDFLNKSGLLYLCLLKQALIQLKQPWNGQIMSDLIKALIIHLFLNQS
jgi:hypothetical protein